MKPLFARNWDLLLMFALLTATSVYPIVTGNISQGQVVGSIYEKIKTTLTISSILLAFVGVVLASKQFQEFKFELARALSWYLVSTISGIATLGMIPTRYSLDEVLSHHRHPAVWSWLYVSGPIMYGAVLLQAIWLFLLALKMAKQDPHL